MVYLKVVEIKALTNEEIIKVLENAIFNYNKSAKMSNYIDRIKKEIFDRLECVK